VGGTGSIYTFYGPEEPLFKSLTDNFLKKARKNGQLVLQVGRIYIVYVCICQVSLTDFAFLYLYVYPYMACLSSTSL
jgi:hypothetical protein